MLKYFGKYNKDPTSFFQREKDRLPASATTVSMPKFESIPVKNWVAGNDSILEMLNCLHPTIDSEDKRQNVIEYLRSLFKHTLGAEIFVYGSVPLKTYLPHGDIDLTVLGTSDNGSLLQMVLDVLTAEEQRKRETFVIQDIRSIDAEIKVVKCIVDGITVDITFNQLGGLCSLCFLEEIDRLVAKNHLFKRSIIVIKAWCYYESHIVGASHGFISTYGLEILILFIFHLYNASLTDPLMVLYRFLEYYSNFDWSNFCIGMDGPVCKELLPDIIVTNPIQRTLLGGTDLRNIINAFMVRDEKSDSNNTRNLRPKFLNIVDPLKDTNNLGRSVHVNADFMRIKSALRYGARKLAEIMRQPSENIQGGIKKFFKNTFKLNSSIFKGALSNGKTNGYFRISGFDSLSSKLDNEQDVGSDGLFEFGNREEIYGLEENKILNSFADLSGHHGQHIRNLLFAHKFLGLGISRALLEASKPYTTYNGGGPSEPTAYQLAQLARRFYPGLNWLQRNPNVPPFILAASSMAQGTGSYIPVLDISRRGRRRGTKTLMRPVQRGRWVYQDINLGADANNNSPQGGSGEPSRMGSQKLRSGSAEYVNIRNLYDRTGAPSPVGSQEIESGTPSRVGSKEMGSGSSANVNIPNPHDRFVAPSPMGSQEIGYGAPRRVGSKKIGSESSANVNIPNPYDRSVAHRSVGSQEIGSGVPRRVGSKIIRSGSSANVNIPNPHDRSVAPSPVGSREIGSGAPSGMGSQKIRSASSANVNRPNPHDRYSEPSPMGSQKIGYGAPNRVGSQKIGSGSAANVNIPKSHDRFDASSPVGSQQMGYNAPSRVCSQKLGSGSVANVNKPNPHDMFGARSPIGSQEIRSGAPSHVNTQRKLIFGDFGPNPETDHVEIDHVNALVALTYFEPRRTERAHDQPVELNDSEEFPPLSVKCARNLRNFY